MNKRFEVKIVRADELEDVLNYYEPYRLIPFAVVPETLQGILVTQYKIIYKAVPEENLKECELLKP